MNAFQKQAKNDKLQMDDLCDAIFATTVNYLDRQVLSLTWDEFIKPEFHWDESHYGTITSVFSIVYAICMLFAGRFVDWMGNEERIPLGLSAYGLPVPVCTQSVVL